MPNFKRDYPGLRLSQLKDLMYKAFQKSPENPFNQANIVQYNATKDETEELKCKFHLTIHTYMRGMVLLIHFYYYI